MATILTDDFESYSTGRLAGQSGDNSWVDDWNTYNAVETSYCADASLGGTKGVYNNGDNKGAQTHAVGTATPEGKTVIYFMYTGGVLSDGAAIQFYESTNLKGTVGQYGGKIKYRGDSAYVVLVDAPVDGQWYCCETRYSYDQGGKHSFRVDGGTYSDWTSGFGAFSSAGCDRISIENDYNNICYLDYIAEDPLPAPTGTAPRRGDMMVLGVGA